MSLLEKNTIKKSQIDKNATKLGILDNGNKNSGEYKVKTICNSTIYIKKLADYLARLYYLVSWENWVY